MTKHRPQTIAFLDSGVGGLAALRESLLLRPRERYIYLADELLFPYSSSPPRTLNHHLRHALELFDSHGVDFLVLPSGVIVAPLVEQLATGGHAFKLLEPTDRGISLAIDRSAHNHIGVICSPIRGLRDHFTRCAEEHSSTATVTTTSSLAVSSLVQRSSERTAELVEAIRVAVQPLRHTGVDSVLIDCSHTALVDDLVQRSLGSNVKITSSSKIASAMVDELYPADRAEFSGDSNLQLWSTGDIQIFSRRAGSYLQMPIPNSQFITF